jgi:adenosylcobinamide-GDP ribazoletransferase
MKLRPFFVALQFLTRIPNPFLSNISDRQIGHSLLFYPVIGLLIGLILIAITIPSADASTGVAAALSLAIWALITGGLHLDGLADSADAWLGGYGDRERTLQIMKDPCCGPAAVVLVTLVLIIKFASLETLINHNQFSAIILAPVLGRTMLPILFLTTTYVSKAGLGSVLVEHLPRTPAWIVITVAMLSIVLTTGLNGAILCICAMGTLLLLRMLMIKRINGTTGDTAGATVELTEVVVLVISVFLI